LTPDEQVNVEIQFDSATGNVTLRKAAAGPNFDGVLVLVGDAV